jgi:hypothetical protein
VLAVVALAGVLGASWGTARWYTVRAWRRAQLQYHAATEAEYRDFDRRLHEQIGFFRQASGDVRAVTAATDRIFELLRTSPAAANSREVDSWRLKPPSPERTAVALRWAEVADDECRYYAALHGIWRRDYERGGVGHHITDDEVPPFRMPAGWTQADLLYRSAGQ